MRAYKVYKYTNTINGKVYIGQTRQSIEDRAQGNGWGYKKCPHFASAIKHYGWNAFKCEILHDNLTREEADILETKYIKYYRDELNMAYNIEDGGKSKGVHRNSEEIKRMISESMKGKNAGAKNGMYGKPSSKRLIVYQYDLDKNLINTYPSISLAANLMGIMGSTLSNTLKIGPIRIDNYIYSTSELKDININDIRVHRKINIKVHQYDLDKNLINTYKSTVDAIKTGLVTQNIIDRIKNYPYLHNGYIWVRSDTDFDINEYKTINDLKNAYKGINNRYFGYTIKVYDNKGVYLNSYNSMNNVCKELKIVSDIVRYAHSGPWFAHNYIITNNDNTLEGDELVIAAYLHVAEETQCKPIFLFDFNGKLVNTYKSIQDARKDYRIPVDSFRRCFKNGPFKYKGYIWSDVDNLYPIESIVERSNGNEIVSKENMGRQVVQVDGDNIIKEYKNMSNLAKELGVNRHTLRLKLVKGEFIHNNLHYRYK